MLGITNLLVIFMIIIFPNSKSQDICIASEEQCEQLAMERPFKACLTNANCKKGYSCCYVDCIADGIRACVKQEIEKPLECVNNIYDENACKNRNSLLHFLIVMEPCTSNEDCKKGQLCCRSQCFTHIMECTNGKSMESKPNLPTTTRLLSKLTTTTTPKPKLTRTPKTTPKSVVNTEITTNSVLTCPNTCMETDNPNFTEVTFCNEEVECGDDLSCCFDQCFETHVCKNLIEVYN